MFHEFVSLRRSALCFLTPVGSFWENTLGGLVTRIGDGFLCRTV
jgi:hypothetical protein